MLRSASARCLVLVGAGASYACLLVASADGEQIREAHIAVHVWRAACMAGLRAVQ